MGFSELLCTFPLPWAIALAHLSPRGIYFSLYLSTSLAMWEMPDAVHQIGAHLRCVVGNYFKDIWMLKLLSNWQLT